MADFSQPVEFSFIITTIVMIFAVVAVGIFLVKRGKN
jgi:multisubunit Na+/H+ antiporter MnhC subunit